MQNRQGAPKCGWRELSKFSHQTLAVDRTNLVENNVTCPALETTGYAKGIGMDSGREGRHDKRLQVCVELIR